jgi:hypothetical protein
MVKWIVCSAVGGKPIILKNKKDNLRKQEGQRLARSRLDLGTTVVEVGQSYIVPDCRHWKNEKLWVARGLAPTPPVLSRTQGSRERSRKFTQFVIVMDLLLRGRPMTDYPLTHTLLNFLAVPDLPKKHWALASAGGMADNLKHIIDERTCSEIQQCRFFAISCDEVTSIANEVWISIHIYVVNNYARLPILLSCKRVVEGCYANNLAKVITHSLVEDGGLTLKQIAEKSISFGADDATVFQGYKGGVTKLLNGSNAQYMVGLHCVAHKTNLAAICLEKLPVVKKIEALWSALYSCFSRSPARNLSFVRLADDINNSGNKILRNVKTRWISMLPAMKRVLEEYKVLVAQMATDNFVIAKNNLKLLCDFQTLISLPCLIPLLESVNELIKFAQS